MVCGKSETIQSEPAGVNLTTLIDIPDTFVYVIASVAKMGIDPLMEIMWRKHGIKPIKDMVAYFDLKLMKASCSKKARTLFEHIRATDQLCLFSNEHCANIGKGYKGKRKLPSTVPKLARLFRARSAPPRHVPISARC